MTTTNIKSGYKKTKLGWIPEEWKIIKLEKYCHKIMVGIASSATHAYRDKGIPLLRNQNIKENYLDESDILFIDEEYEKSHKNKRLNYLDVITVRTGYPGLSCVISKHYQDAQCFTSLITRPNQDHLNSDWLAYYINSPIGKKLTLGLEAGGAQKNINSGSLKKLLLPDTPLPEQKKIADILSTWDKAIETTQALIKKLQLRKKGLMQQLLTGKKRLPGFCEDWKEVQFSDAANRLTKKNEELHDNVVTISAQRGFLRQEDFFKKRVASKTLSGYYLVNKGDFCYNKSYSKGYPMGAFKRLDDFEKAVVTTLYICFRLRENVNSDFMVNYFEGGMIVNNLMKIAQEGGRAHGLLNISLGDFFGLKMTLPKIEEQSAIAQVLTKADAEIHQTQKYLEQLQEQKKGLMQQLLTGQKRVKV